jgi:hypothetical protein
MKSIKTFLRKWGIHSFLLPLFFVLHNYFQYYGLVSPTVAAGVFIKINAFVVLSFLLIRWITKNTNRSFQIITLVEFIWLFYGVIKDFLGKTMNFSFAASYKVLLPSVFIILLLLIAVIVKTKDFTKANLFQNVLLLSFIIADGTSAMFTHSALLLGRNLLVPGNLPDISRHPLKYGKPDIYYLLFDCYPGRQFLNDFMGFDNGAFDSALQSRGFHVISNPRSNYNRTAFSMASGLNFDYLRGFNNDTRLTPKLYTDATLSIKHSATPKILARLGYKLYNLSIFEIGDSKPLHKEHFLTLPEQNVLLFNTLGERIKSDILWNFIKGRYKIPAIGWFNTLQQSELVKEYEKKRDFNGKIIDSVLIIPLIKNGAPKFVYAHFYLPHPPFFYDENGVVNDLDQVVTEKSLLSKRMFLAYLQYTNKVIVKMVDSILLKSAAPPIIIIQSDHGYRDFEGGPAAPYLFFKNYTAFYFPDKNYSMLYDTISNVNTFPVVLNKYFNFSIPIKADTSTFLPY